MYGPGYSGAGNVRPPEKIDKEQGLGILNHLEQQQLSDLLEHDEKIDELVADNPQVGFLNSVPDRTSLRVLYFHTDISDPCGL